MSFNQFVLREQYLKVKGLGDRLVLMKEQIDWAPFVPMVRNVFNDGTSAGGRPHTDELIVVRAMLLQSLYGLSDPELEFQCNDRLSFRNFLGFPENVPDFTTIWKIRDRLQKEGIDVHIWAELQRQIAKKGYTIQKGVIRDATFVEANVGKKRYYKEKKAKKEGKEIIYTPKQKQHIDVDGSFSVKHGQVHYGYKSHTKVDVKHQLIRKFAVTTASVHDGEIDLIRDHDKKAYRDKGYFGRKLYAKNVKDNTMQRGTRAGPISEKDEERNFRISKIRAPGERLYSVIKTVFNNSRTHVKTIARVTIKEMFKFFAYNLYQLVTLTRKELARAL
jgi:IS5 family transposase